MAAGQAGTASLITFLPLVQVKPPFRGTKVRSATAPVHRHRESLVPAGPFIHSSPPGGPALVMLSCRAPLCRSSFIMARTVARSRGRFPRAIPVGPSRRADRLWPPPCVMLIRQDRPATAASSSSVRPDTGASAALHPPPGRVAEPAGTGRQPPGRVIALECGHVLRRSRERATAPATAGTVETGTSAGTLPCRLAWPADSSVPVPTPECPVTRRAARLLPLIR